LSNNNVKPSRLFQVVFRNARQVALNLNKLIFSERPKLRHEYDPAGRLPSDRIGASGVYRELSLRSRGSGQDRVAAPQADVACVGTMSVDFPNPLGPVLHADLHQRRPIEPDRARRHFWFKETRRPAINQRSR
jgi:hypothetical protein